MGAIAGLARSIRVRNERIEELEMEIEELKAEVGQFQSWVNGLQSGMYINCGYCGHRYGPNEDTPVAMADVLKAHIEKCPKHPLAHAKKKIRLLESMVEAGVGPQDMETD